MSWSSEVLADSPISYWRHGEPSGTEAADIQGLNKGTYQNTPTLGVPGAIVGEADTAVSLAAASKEYVSVPDSASLDFGDNVTVVFCVKRASIGTQQTIFDKGSGSLIIRFTPGNKILVRRNNVANICESTGTYTDTTKWIYGVVTKAGATTKIYTQKEDVTGAVTNSTLVNNAIALGIGAADAGTTDYFSGSIDEVAVYNTALSKARIEALYDAAIASGVAITAPPAIASATAPAPVPTVRIEPAAAASTAQGPTPTPVVTVGAPAASATASAPAPTPALSISPPPAAAAASAPAPTVKGPAPKPNIFDFEVDDEGWGPISSAVVSQTTEEAHGGVGSLKVECASHSSFEGAVREITEDFTPGEREQYVAWVKAPVGKSLRLRLEDDAGKDETFFEGTGDWRRVSVRRTIDPAATFVQIGVHVGGTQTTTFYVDDAQLALAPTEFTGDWESGDLSEWDLVQALPDRITASKASPAQGRYAGRFEVQEGDVEPMTGSNRAEVQSGLEYKEGDKRYFRDRIKVVAWDFAHWGIPWQIHDDSEEEPRLCAQIKGSVSDPRLWLGPGDVSAEYWEAPFVLDRWYELIYGVEFGKEGAVEVWVDREQQLLLNGKTRFEEIDTLGNPLAYDKLGIYRSAESVGTAVVFHDDYLVSKTFPPLPTLSRVAVTREHPPDKLAVRIADPSTGASIARWAEDEARAENVIGNLRKTGEMPGGHKEMTCSLPRDPRVDWPDLDTYVDVFVEGAGGEKVWEGRIDKKPKTDGERLLIEPAAVGHQAALQDRKALRMGFIDGDLSKWGDPSTQRKIEIDSFYETRGVEISSGWQDTGENGPSLIIRISFEDGHPLGEQWYSGDGVRLGALGYDFKNISGALAGTNDIARLNTTDVAGWTASGTNHGNTSATQQWLTTTNPDIRYAVLQTFYEGEYAEAGTDSKAWQNLKILSYIAAQNLTLQGTWPNVGYTSGQMLRLAIPLFTYLEATEESVEDEGYVIPQAWYSEDGDMASVVTDLTKYEPLRWFVMNGKLFEVRAPGTFGRRWQASAGPSELKETGEDGSRLWDRLVVSYQDVDGRTYTVGWPGSGANLESEALLITDPDHPAVKAGKPREDLLALRGISTEERALEAGERWLKEGNELSHAGEAVLRGYIMDDKAVFRPVSQVQPGDHIQFDGSGYREIVAASCDHDSRSASVTLDAPSDALDALLERYQAGLSPLGL